MSELSGPSPQPSEPPPPAAPEISPETTSLPPAPNTPTPIAISIPSGPAPTGRHYGFPCGYCSSRLEAVESMAGQTGTCPTCGNPIVIPILDRRNRLIDPTTNEIIKQDPHPVHAYAAAGHKAPAIVPVPGPAGEETFERRIECPRCQRLNPLSTNNCQGCGLPFTMEGTLGDAISGTNTWAVASLVLGIVGICGGFFCIDVPPILAVIFGIIAMRGASQTGTNSGQGMAVAGIILGAIGTLIGGILFVTNYARLF